MLGSEVEESHAWSHTDLSQGPDDDTDTVCRDVSETQDGELGACWVPRQHRRQATHAAITHWPNISIRPEMDSRENYQFSFLQAND